MDVNIFEADNAEEEAQVKVVTSLTVDDLVKILKQGDVIATEWLKGRKFDCEYRIVVQGRKIGVGKGGKIIDLHDGGPLVTLA